jgi:hypothetical protein
MTKADQFNLAIAILIDLAAGNPIAPECIRAMVAQCYCVVEEENEELTVTFFDGSSVTFNMGVA